MFPAPHADGERPGWRWGVANQAAAERLGWSEPAGPFTGGGPLRIEPCTPFSQPADVANAASADLCVALVCTLNFLPFARTAVQSFLTHHPAAVAVVLVLDADDPGAVDCHGAEVRIGRELMGQRFPFLALKFTAFELSAASKSFLLLELVESGRFRKIVFLDADVLVLSPMTELLDALDGHDVVACPHMMAPLPVRPSAPERPTSGAIAAVGILNTGLIGLRPTAATARFLATWREMVIAPGAFTEGESPQHEQLAFNWVSAFGPDVHVLTDRSYNVAYWNLHERTLAWHLGGPALTGNLYTVDGRPLVAFHFSGFSPYNPRVLSIHDGRHSRHLIPAVAHLIDDYTSLLSKHGLPDGQLGAYRLDQLGSGLPLGRTIRETCKRIEAAIDSSHDPWTPDGERHYCTALLRPTQGSGTMLPAVVSTIYAPSAWLRVHSPDADLRPDRVIEWFLAHGVREYGLEQLVDRHCSTLPGASTVDELDYLARARPGLLTDLAAPLAADRHTLIERLSAAGLHAEAERLLLLGTSHFDLGAMYLARRIWETEPGVRERFPSPLYDDAAAFVAWLRAARSRGLAIPARVPDVVEARAAGRAAARVVSRVMSNWGLQCTAPLAFVGVDSDAMATALLAALCHELEYDADDVIAFLWTVDIEPWRGVGITLELPIHRVRIPSTYDEAGQEDVLAPVLERPGILRELAAYREQRRGARHQPRPGPDGPGCSVPSVRQVDSGPRLARVGPIPADGLRHGVNLFGPTRSPIGLGAMARGLTSAVQSLGLPVAENVLGSDAIDAELSLDDVLGTYDHRLDTNIFVTVPHFHERPLGFHSRRVLDGRRNIAYLAWEQRNHHPDWREVFADFDEIWSLSTFAADTLARALDRPVLTMPCVVDLDKMPPPATKETVGLDSGECHFLYVFDANSSFARKNPEAAIAAFSSAFTTSDAARLLIRVSNAHRRVHEPRLRRLRSMAAECGARVSFVTGELSHAQILGLLSAVDAYVSLHRAEGFGYTCAEAMAYGKPVIASRYSGNLDFMDDTNSLLVDCNEVEVVETDGPFVRGSVWAEPSLDQAVAHLRAVYGDGVPTELADRARASIGSRLSPAAVADTISGHLRRGGSS